MGSRKKRRAETVIDDGEEAVLKSLRDGFIPRIAAFWARISGPKPTYWHTRFVFLRLLGLVYSVAFFSLYKQLLPLFGSRGLLPVSVFLRSIEAHYGSGAGAFKQLPTLFWFGSSDGTLVFAAALGAALSIALLLGVTNAVVQIVLWALYLSFIHVGQIFYGYGWESLLVETGFLSIFLCPLRSIHPYPAHSPPQAPVIWLLRWLVFRLMLGAGLIKLRGDACWTDLTCLLYHYETQPNPNPLAYWLHHMPRWFHVAGVLFNHLVELIAPFFVFGPRPARHIAGVLLVAFQVFLIASGNLSFLNWLTIAICIACFDDRLLARLLPRRLRDLAARAQEAAPKTVPLARRIPIYALVAVVAILSLAPVENLLSSHQRMNSSYDPLRLVNTYGMFGGVGRRRPEVVIEGTRSETPDDSAEWVEYQLPCKPGDVRRRPCVITPYHYRLDWQVWFAAMSKVDRQPWLINLVYKLLKADPGVRSLLAVDPFGDEPPRYIRAKLYDYSFTKPGDDAWWTRTEIDLYLRPVSLDDPSLSAYVKQRPWLDGRDSGQGGGW